MGRKKPATCPTCAGNKEIYVNGKWEKCKECKGIGFILVDDK